MGEQYEVDCFTPHHARSRLVGELRIVLETDGFVESHGRLEVGDRQAHKNHLAHHSFLYLLGCQSPASGAKGDSPCLKTIESPPNRHRMLRFSGIPTVKLQMSWILHLAKAARGPFRVNRVTLAVCALLPVFRCKRT
jgi:hypothetical protein